VLKNMKGAVEVRNSVCHSAVIFANAVMHAGTTVDAFLRESMDWLTRATNWAKFSATAGLGVIHRGHLAQARRRANMQQQANWKGKEIRYGLVVSPACARPSTPRRAGSAADAQREHSGLGAPGWPRGAARAPAHAARLPVRRRARARACAARARQRTERAGETGCASAARRAAT